MLLANVPSAIKKTLTVGMICLSLNSGTAESLPMITIIPPLATLSLRRISTRDTVVVGELYLNGQFECNTSENQATLISTGTYNVITYKSPKLGHYVPLILVKGRTGIEIHAGKHSQGCIVISTPAFTQLMQHLVFPASISVS
jgi:Family of unknown function (DUF5675)